MSDADDRPNSIAKRVSQNNLGVSRAPGSKESSCIKNFFLGIHHLEAQEKRRFSRELHALT